MHVRNNNRKTFNSATHGRKGELELVPGNTVLISRPPARARKLCPKCGKGVFWTCDELGVSRGSWCDD